MLNPEVYQDGIADENTFTFYPQDLPWSKFTLFQPCSQLYWSLFKRPSSANYASWNEDPKEFLCSDLRKIQLHFLARALYFRLAQAEDGSDIELLT